MTKQKKEQNKEKDLIQQAIEAGLHSLLSQPGMKERAPYITNNLDRDKIYSLAGEMQKELENKNMPDMQKAETLYKGIASYIASGQALNEKGRGVLIEKGYKGKEEQNLLEKLVGFIKPNKFEGEKYFDKARNAYGDMYELLAQDRTTQEEFPELVKAAKSMKLYGFLDVALKNFKAHGMMDDKTYNKLSKELYVKTSEDSAEGIKGIEKYILSREEKANANAKEYVPKAAAWIAIAVGIVFLIITGTNITGNAIGNLSSNVSGLIGGGLILIGLVLFLITRKKHKKKRF